MLSVAGAQKILILNMLLIAGYMLSFLLQLVAVSQTIYFLLLKVSDAAILSDHWLRIRFHLFLSVIYIISQMCHNMLSRQNLQHRQNPIEAVESRGNTLPR